MKYEGTLISNAKKENKALLVTSPVLIVRPAVEFEYRATIVHL